MAGFAAAAGIAAAGTAVVQGALSLALTAIDAGSAPEVRERLLAGGGRAA